MEIVKIDNLLRRVLTNDLIIRLNSIFSFI